MPKYEVSWRMTGKIEIEAESDGDAFDKFCILGYSEITDKCENTITCTVVGICPLLEVKEVDNG